VEAGLAKKWQSQKVSHGHHHELRAGKEQDTGLPPPPPVDLDPIHDRVWLLGQDKTGCHKRLDPIEITET
jgi:hypothetical protein